MAVWQPNHTYNIGDTITAPGGYAWNGTTWYWGYGDDVIWTVAGGYAGAPYTSGATYPFNRDGNPYYYIPGYWALWDERVTWYTPYVSPPATPADVDITRSNSIKDLTPLEALRNLEMSARGRFYIDAEGNATWETRYTRTL